MLRVGLRHGLRYGVVDTLENGGAVAIWLHSEGSRMSAWRMVRAGVLAAGLAMGCGNSRRVLKFLRFIGKARDISIAEPHWYLLSLAVSPERQGAGVGRALLRHGLGRAKAQGLACFLETTKERNVKLYERYGFKVSHRAPLPNGGPVVWSMVAGLAEGLHPRL